MRSSCLPRLLAGAAVALACALFAPFARAEPFSFPTYEEDSGVGLPDDKQARAQQISEEIVTLGQEFSRRIREDKTVEPYTEAELEGVPRDVWKDARRDGQGRVLLGLAYPVSGPVLQNAIRAAARVRMRRAVQQKGGPDN